MVSHWGSDVYIEKHFCKDHVKICPRSIFSSNRRLGLRDIVLKVQKCLKQDQKVVVDDDNGSFAKRSAYLKLIQKKFPDKTVALVAVFPKYGQSQVLWNQEVCLNEEDVTINCVDLTSWFDPSTGKVDYITNEEPDEEEGYKMFHHTAILENFSPFMFDIPGLLIQIESIFTKSESMFSLRQGVKDICMNWNEQNPLGRIIFIQFGNKEPSEEIKLLLTKLAKQLGRVREQAISKNMEFPVTSWYHSLSYLPTSNHKSRLDFPFYLFHVSDPSAASPYLEPPNPGILAFLQKRHCLFLHCTKTVYIYTSQDHMKMAQAAGVNCVKITQLLNNAALVNGSHVITRSPVPDFLRTMEILPTPRPVPRTPTLPGMTQDRDWLNTYMRCELPQGREEFIFARDLETVLKYQELYRNCVSKLAHPECIYTESHDREEQVRTGPNTSLSSSTRKLPTWMTGRVTTPTKQSLPRTDSASSTEEPVRQTIYVMNEDELLDVAKDVLKQAGKNIDASDDKARNETVPKKIYAKCPKRKSPSGKVQTEVFHEEESDSGCPGPSGWKPHRGLEYDEQQARGLGMDSKCAILDDLMAETKLRRASPRKTRKGVQAKNDGKDKTHISTTTTTTSRLLPTSTETRNAKRILNYVEKECEKSKSMKTKSRNSSGTSPTQTTCRSVKDFSKTSEGDFDSVISDFQEPHNSDDFTSANYNSTETRYRKRSSKSGAGSHAQKSLRSSEKDSTKMKVDNSERHKLKIRKTEGKNNPCASKKPDLSVLDEIFF